MPLIQQQRIAPVNRLQPNCTAVDNLKALWRSDCPKHHKASMKAYSSEDVTASQLMQLPL